jgi:hypothetical protein
MPLTASKEEAMPGGSAYPGPTKAFELYAALVSGSGTGCQVKGARNPYTSRNGHMFSFLDPEGGLALRLSDELGDEFRAAYDSGPVISYGGVMRGYVAVPDDLLRDTASLEKWFTASFEWIGTLKPKPTKK